MMDERNSHTTNLTPDLPLTSAPPVSPWRKCGMEGRREEETLVVVEEEEEIREKCGRERRRKYSERVEMEL